MGLTGRGVPQPVMFRWNQKSQPEMEIDSQKSTGSFPKLKLGPTQHRPKPNGFQIITTMQAGERAYQFKQFLWLLVRAAPTSTQPKHVLKADCDPEGPNHRPWSIVQLKMSAPRRRSTLPGVPKSGSGRRIFNKCYHLRLNGAVQDGRLVVTLGSATTSTARILPWWFDMFRSTNLRE